MPRGDHRSPRLRVNLALCGIGLSKVRFLICFVALVSAVWTLQERLVGTVSLAVSSSLEEIVRFDDIPTGSSFHGYASKEEYLARSSRFPSVDERVRVYMSDWYTPPCKSNTDGFIHFSNIQSDSPVFLVKEIQGRTSKRPLFLINTTDASKTIWHIERAYVKTFEGKRKDYKKDIKKYLFPAFDKVERKETFPTLMEAGDSKIWKAYMPSTGENGMFPNIPFMRKYRLAMNRTDVARLTSKECYEGQREVLGKYEEDFQPIVWLLRVERYYGMLPQIAKEDVPWSEKKNVAVFRGVGSGTEVPRWNNFEKVRRRTALDECLFVKARCRLAYMYQNSSLIDAKVVASKGEYWDRLYGKLQREGIDLEGNKMSREEMLKYKAIILLEGNDVSSGLKWGLLSQSVVMMQPPTCTSWAMEEMLEPWVHYIPLNQNLTDVEEKTQWIIDNDKEAERIAQRGSLWMKDLFFHRDSEQDNQMIMEEIARRYSNFFVGSTDLSDA